jgi:hypothetical protein
MFRIEALKKETICATESYLTAYNITVRHALEQWYSTFFVRVPPDIISLQLCTPKVVGT